MLNNKDLVKEVKTNSYIQALKRRQSHRDIIEKMLVAKSDEELLFLARKIVAKEETQKFLAEEILKEIYNDRRDIPKSETN